MQCLWPECHEIHCHDCPAGQDWQDFEENPMTAELKVLFDTAFAKEFPAVRLPSSLPPMQEQGSLHASACSVVPSRVVG